MLSCASFVKFSFLINGSIVKEFIPSQGLCQGDPLSPNLFILCSELFSYLILKKVDDDCLHGIKINNDVLAISHLMYADNLMISYRVNVKEAMVV